MESKKGYWIRSEPENQTQVASQYGSDKVGSIVKSCIKDYISSFLDMDGKNRSLVAAAFPSMSAYLTDEYKHNLDNDPEKRELQLCNLYERVKEKLPCILLDDASVLYKNPGLGRFNSTTLLGDKTQFWFHIVRDVSVSIIIGANDTSTCSNIRDAVSVMFGDLSRFTCGNILLKTTDNSSSWEVILNSQPIEIGTLERVPAGSGESANNLVYFSQSTVTCRFECSFAVERPATEYNIVKDSWDMSLSAPDTIKVGEVGVLQILNARPFGLRLFVSDENIIRLVKLSEDTFRILARRKGTATIQLIDEDSSAPRSQWSSFSPKIVLKKDITII